MLPISAISGAVGAYMSSKIPSDNLKIYFDNNAIPLTTDIYKIEEKEYQKRLEELVNLLNIKDIINIISIEYFQEDNLERYIKYYEDKNLDIETILTYVNIGLDNEYYTNI